MKVIDADELKQNIEVGHFAEMSMKNVNYINGYSTGLECAIAQVEEAEEVDAIIIPKNATNGDMIKAMFNVEIKHIFEDLNIIVVILDGKSKIFELDWWNAPYKKEAESEEK